MKECNYPNCKAESVVSTEEWFRVSCGKLFTCWGWTNKLSPDCVRWKQMEFNFDC